MLIGTRSFVELPLMEILKLRCQHLDYRNKKDIDFNDTDIMENFWELIMNGQSCLTGESKFFNLTKFFI